MKFIDFDREYFDNVHKLERGSITLGEYADAGEKLLNKVKADAIDEFAKWLNDRREFCHGNIEGFRLEGMSYTDDVEEALRFYRLKEQKNG